MFEVIKPTKGTPIKTQLILIMNLKCDSIRNINLRTKTTINTATYTVTNTHTGSTTDTFEKFIEADETSGTNFIYNFLFNNFNMTNYNFSINITIYPPYLTLPRLVPTFMSIYQSTLLSIFTLTLSLTYLYIQLYPQIIIQIINQLDHQHS